jgi:acyl-CoA thioester hydrolase
MPKEIDLNQELSKFKHKNTFKIHFHQIDAAQILYNVEYFKLFENGRISYMQQFNLIHSIEQLMNDFLVMTAHNDIDYFRPARFNDEVEIWTRISEIRNSSLIFENLAVCKGVILAKGSTVYVHVDAKTQRSKPVPPEIVKNFQEYENSNN